MTKEEINALINTHVDGQGDQVDIGAALPKILYGIIDLIPEGGGGGGAMASDVNLRDYDGTIVASYTAEDFAALTELPTPPAHEGLTFQGWNISLADAQAYCAQYGMMDIGAIYITSDGKTRIYITLPEGRTTPTLGLGINGSVDVDWGDGSTHDTMTGSDLTTLVNQQHTYSQPGDYIITIEVVENSEITFLASNYSSGLLWDGAQNYIQAYKSAVKSVLIGQGVTSIGDNAFRDCHSLKSISIPQGVTSIGSSAFYNCYSLTSISIPQGVTYIRDYVFNTCTSLTSISIPQGVETINGNAFQNCYNLTSISIPQSVTYIGDVAFDHCYSLTSISIPQGVTSIGDSVFNACYSLTSVSIPQGVTSIGSSVFGSCTSLTSISIPQSVRTISGNAFYTCNSMAIFRIYATTTPTISSSTFSSIPADCIIYVPADSVEAYKSASNWSAQSDKIQPMP